MRKTVMFAGPTCPTIEDFYATDLSDVKELKSIKVI